MTNQPRTKVTSFAIATTDDGLEVDIYVARRLDPSSEIPPQASDLPNDVRAALVEWISGPPITAHPDRIARPAGHG